MTKKKIKNKQASYKSTIDPLALKKIKVVLGTIITVLACLLYANTISHDYTLDDHPAIDENKITVQGFAGIPTLLKTDYWYGYKDELRGPIYRPTSLILYAIVWQIIPDNPHVYHFLNVLVYAMTCLMLFLVLCQLFRKYNLVLPFICTILYTAHPIHTEVVNNIKSMDEMLCFFFGITSLWFILKYMTTKTISALVLGGLTFFLSLISKETGIAFLVVIPLVIYFFDDSVFKSNRNIFGLLIVLTGLYLLLRFIILHDLHKDNITLNVLNNALNGAKDVVSRYATVFYILVRYLILLIFPHPLSCDYNFAQIPIQTLTSPGALLGILLFPAMAIYSLFHFRKYNFLVFGYLFFLVTLAPVSNFFFIGGSTMAERFLYMPSLGFSIVLGYFLIYITKTEWLTNNFKNLAQFFSKQTLLFTIVFIILCLYSIKTYSRNKDWKDNLTIFSHDVQISTQSATAHKIAGTELYSAVVESPNLQNKADTFQLAKSHLKRSLEIFPYYIGPSATLGVIYYIENNFDSAYYYQNREIQSQSQRNDIDLNYNFGKTLNKLLKYDESIQVSNVVIAANPKHEGANFNLALAYTNKGDTEKGLYYFSKVIEINPQRGDAYYFSGLILRARGDEATANEYFNKATSLGYKL